MLFRWPESTNKGNALLRLVDQFQTAPFLRDEYISWFFTDAEVEAVREYARTLPGTPANGLERHELTSFWWTLLRERYVDEVLRIALRSGVKQLLLLGAGLDTRCLRLPELGQHHVTTYELDLPATVSLKANCLVNRLGALPPLLKLIAADLNEQRLDVIFDSGFDRHLPSICVWQGVSYYLPEATVLYILDFLRSELEPGLILSFDCCSPLMTYPNNEVPGIRESIRRLSQIGEPYLFGCEAPSMESLLMSRGFSVSETRYPDDLEAYYGRSRTLPRNMWYLITAQAARAPAPGS